MTRTALVCGAGGFVGSHLVKRLKAEGYTEVVGVDVKQPEFSLSAADAFLLGDLRLQGFVRNLLRQWHPQEVYQLATDMGGAGYIFTGDVDAQVMHTGAQINLNVLEESRQAGVQRIFFSSSACVYNHRIQQTLDAKGLQEGDAYPAWPDSEYGWEKLFAERLYLAYHRNYGMEVRIARFHSIVGPEGTWTGGKEKVFAALCRKIAEAPDGGEIEIWGDGEQTRTFLHVEDCTQAIHALTTGAHTGPFNIGSEVLISINGLAKLIMAVAGKSLEIRHIDGPQGVRGRKSDNTAINAATGWHPHYTLTETVRDTYQWIMQQVEVARAAAVR